MMKLFYLETKHHLQKGTNDLQEMEENLQKWKCTGPRS